MSTVNIGVVDKFGNPVKRIYCRFSYASQTDEQAWFDGFTDDNGRMAREMLPDNSYRVYVNTRNVNKKFATLEHEFTLPGNSFTVVLEARALLPLTIDGDDIKTSDGDRLVIAGTSNFMLAQLVAEGVDIKSRLYRGPNFARLFMTHGYISDQAGLKRFHPDNYGMTEWLSACERAIDICNENGQYVQANLICDNQLFNKDVNYLRSLQDSFIEMFKNKKGIYSLGNENKYNGFNANDFSKPNGVIAACGSGGTGQEAPLSNGQAWDIQHQHLRRDIKMFIDIPPVDAPTYNLQHKLIFDETIGFADFDDAGRRSSNKVWAFRIGREASAFNGAIIHVHSASHSDTLNSKEQECVDAFVLGSGI
jgi:hypothetical protein